MAGLDRLMFREELRQEACLQERHGKWALAGCRVKEIYTLCFYAFSLHCHCYRFIMKNRIHYRDKVMCTCVCVYVCDMGEVVICAQLQPKMTQ